MRLRRIRKQDVVSDVAWVFEIFARGHHRKSRDRYCSDNKQDDVIPTEYTTERGHTEFWIEKSRRPIQSNEVWKATPSSGRLTTPYRATGLEEEPFVRALVPAR